MNKVKTSFSGVALLLLTAFIWGTSFVSQGEGAKCLQPFSFNGIRTLMGAIVLLPIIFVKDRIAIRAMNDEQRAQHKKNTKKSILVGIIIGLALCAATNFQQYAFDPIICPGASSGKVAFITAMYMFLVPVIGLFIGKRVSFVTWISVLISICGLYFLCINQDEGFDSVSKGDVFSFIAAVFFSIQILLIEKFAFALDGIKVSCAQFFVSGAITCVLMFIFEQPSIENIKLAKIPLLYSGLMSCGLAYTLQIIGQKKCEATIASLLMCLESVFAALSEAVFFNFFAIGNKVLSSREILGCAIMFFAILLSQFVDVLQNKNS